MYVIVESVINPDHDFDYNVRIEPKHIPIKTYIEARDVCLAFILEHGIGGGNWAGGDIKTNSGTFLAYVSYNGRVWDKHAWDGTAKEIKSTITKES